MLVAALLFAAGTAQAAAGDPVRLEGTVAIRVAPRHDAPVLKRLSGDLQALERDRRGGWIEIEIPAALVRGWIPEPAAGAGENRAEPVSSEPVPATANALPAGEDEPLAGGRLARLLDPPPPAFAPRSARLDRPQADTLDRFRTSVRYLDAVLAREHGNELLGEVRATGPGTVQVMAAAGWADLPVDARERVLERLFDRWLAASEAPQDLRVEIRDPTGDLAMAKAGP